MAREICQTTYVRKMGSLYCYYVHETLQMAFSYVWSQIIPRNVTKDPNVAVQNLQNVLLGRKR